MPRRELTNGQQVTDWLEELGASLQRPGNMILIGSAALLWHAQERGIGAEMKRNEPRDRAQADWAKRIGLID